MAPPKSVLITGCSDDGIGSGLALEFASRGYAVFATARNVDKMKSLANKPNVTLLELDVVDGDSINRCAAEVSRLVGEDGLGCLYNNAGHNHFMPFLDTTLEEARDLFEINVWGPLAVCRAFAPLVIKAKGRFVFTTSVSGYVNVPFMGTYGASKRSIEIMAETLRLEMEPFGVTVLSIVTGAVKTLGQTYFGDWHLPKNSLFAALEDLIHKRAQGDDGVARMPLADYSRQVVDTIEAGSSGKFWCGNNSGMVKFMTGWLPQWVVDKGVSQGTGLERVKGGSQN